MVFETERLFVRKAALTDVEFYLTLWNDPEVMKFVGFPNGLMTSKERIENQLKNHSDCEYDQTLVVVEKKSGKSIGECKLVYPDENMISFPDFKFLPEYWGKGYGKELINVICKYSFSKTRAKIIETTPNVKNYASQKLSINSGGKEISRGVYHFPEQKRSFTEDVHFITFQIRKEDWLKQKLVIKQISSGIEKSRICENILRKLPDWFGIEEATKEYIAGVKNTRFLSAEFDGEIVGFYSIISHFPQTSEIYVCGILSEYHRLGIGTKLQNSLEKKLKSDNVKYLTVKTLSASHSDKNYAKTRKFYLAQGFEPLEEFKELWGEDNPCLLLMKVL